MVDTVSVPHFQYSPEHNKNKKVIQARPVMACYLVVPTWDVESRQ